MRARSLFALVVMTGSTPALAEEVAASTTAAPSPAPVMVGHGDGFASPNGQYGAGLSISREQGMRAYGELGVFSYNLFGPVDVWDFSAIVGGGYKIKQDIELEAMLPLGFFHAGGGDVDETGAAVGNLHIGASYVGAKGPLRFKVGGALEWAPWTIDPSQNFGLALAFSSLARSIHDAGLWAPETLSIVAPAHLEAGDQAVGTGDAALGLHIPTDGGDVEVSIQADPGFGYYASENVLIGARLPFIWLITEGGDNAQVAIEPYGRLDFGSAFANARFTLNLDEPLGFGFDEGRIWAIHIGGGAAF